IVSPEDYDLWLDASRTDGPALLELLRPAPVEELIAVQANPRVNSPRNEGPECLIVKEKPAAPRLLWDWGVGYREGEGSFAHPRPHGGQLAQPINRLGRRPAQPAQHQQPKQRIVEGPGIVPNDTHEHPSLALLARPQQGLRFAVLHARCQDLHALRI